jgi:hypothetical protein
MSITFCRMQKTKTKGESRAKKAEGRMQSAKSRKWRADSRVHRAESGEQSTECRKHGVESIERCASSISGHWVSSLLSNGRLLSGLRRQALSRKLQARIREVSEHVQPRASTAAARAVEHSQGIKVGGLSREIGTQT